YQSKKLSRRVCDSLCDARGACSVVLGFGLASVVLAIMLSTALMMFYFMRRRAQLIALFADQLPEAIDIIVRGVRVGLPFISAVALVAREMPDPVGTEFGML